MSSIEDLLTKLKQPEFMLSASLAEQQSTLEQIKILGRDERQANVLNTKENVTLLIGYAFENAGSIASLESLKCLANLLLLMPAARQTFADRGRALELFPLLDANKPTCEFLASRILFLLTYETTLDFRTLVQEHDLQVRIEKTLAGHAERIGSALTSTGVINPVTPDMALAETLKLLFNITFNFHDLIPKFDPCLSALSTILLGMDASSVGLKPPITLVINALLNLDLDQWERPELSEEMSMLGLISERLVMLLELALTKQSEAELEANASPLITLMRRICDIDPKQARLQLATALLPTEKDRELPLGKGDSFAAQLLRLSVSPLVPTLRDNISGLLFELSDKDPVKFVHNIGYGYASGFLLNHNIPVPSSRNSGDDGAAEINPVTGQKLNNEKAAQDAKSLDDMTEEEKEREAERLFVLFERLKATGVMDVQNPVQRFANDGRFEELPD